MNRATARNAAAAALGAALALGGCSVFAPAERPAPPAESGESAPPAVQAPLATHTFAFDPKTTGVVGQLQVTYARGEDTLPDIARRFNLGFDEVVNANPGVDPWLPGEGTRIVLPTQFVLPDAPTEGIVVNLAALRMFHFPPPAKDGSRVVHTYPIGIGKVGWATPAGTTKIVSKRRNPWWTPPASVRREHVADGDPLPARVPPGPDNPLGTRAMNLGWSSYLIHGTNKPAGVGLRASHGCIRMYPEDIDVLFERVPVGTRVTVVNQPLLHRWNGGALYVQSYPVHEELRGEGEDGAVRQHVAYDRKLQDRLFQQAKQHGAVLNGPVVEQVVTRAQGVAIPVTGRGITIDGYLAAARQVENALPAGANWKGDEEDGTAPASQTSATGGR
jgi:L,D-transpeptidase ErfK/SrfK